LWAGGARAGIIYLFYEPNAHDPLNHGQFSPYPVGPYRTAAQVPVSLALHTFSLALQKPLR